MARKENLVSTVPLQVALTDGLIKRLTLLVNTGKWGKTVAEAVERVVSAKIDEILEGSRGELVHYQELPLELEKAGLLDEGEDSEEDFAAIYRRYREFQAFRQMEASSGPPRTKGGDPEP